MWVAVGLLLTLVVGGTVAFVWIRIANSPDEQPSVVQGGLFDDLTGIEDARKSKAHLGAKGLAQAVEAFTINPANPEGAFPNSLNDLIQPPFGGSSLLRNGVQDLLDPWGRQYQLQPQVRVDGTQYILVTTVAPDGTPISQFGIGRNAIPKW
jgi:hypothetical protein